MSSTLKDRFFNKETIKSLSTVISQAHPGFNSKRFMSLIFDNSWKNRELKDRMHHVSAAINEVIDKPYEQALEIVLKANRSLPSGFINMVFPDFVEQYGIEHLKLSMQALKELTSGSSSEFAVRPFIRRYGVDAMSFMYEWSQDKNEHVRRLSSEGCRPLLPWSNPLTDFVKDPTPILPIIQQLKYDEAIYVQKSVGNSMNDISKNHPEIVLKICKEWKIEQEKKASNSKKIEEIKRKNKDSIDFIMHKACRTLLKKGNQDALELFKVGSKESVQVERLKVINKKVEIGGKVEFEFEVVAGNKEKKEKGEEDITEGKDRLKKQEEQQQKEVTQYVNGLRRSKRLNIVAQKQQINTDEGKQDKEDIIIKPTKKSKKEKQLPKEINQQDTSNDNSNSENESDQQDDSDDNLLRLEYKIAYLKSNGTHSSKIFMFKNNFQLNHGSSVKLKASQKMQQLSTRKHYPGKHYIEILVNGVTKAKTDFILIGGKEEEEEEEDDDEE